MVSKSDGVIVFVHADAKKYAYTSKYELLSYLHCVLTTFRDIVRTIGDVIRDMDRSLLASADTLRMRMVSTDSWDVTDLEDEAAARFLHRHSFVVIPDASGESRMHRGRNITHHFQELSPATSKYCYYNKYIFHIKQKVVVVFM